MRSVIVLLAVAAIAFCSAEPCGTPVTAKIVPVDSLGHKLVFEADAASGVIAHFKAVGDKNWENLPMTKVNEKLWETQGKGGQNLQTEGIFLLPGQSLEYFFTYTTEGKTCDSPRMESTPSGIHNEFPLPTHAGTLVTSATATVNLAEVPAGLALYTVGAISAEQAKEMGVAAAQRVQVPVTTLITMHPRELPIQQKAPLTAKQETAPAITNKAILQTYQQQIRQPMTQVLRQPIIQPVRQPIIQPVIQQAQPVVQPEVKRTVETYVVRQVSPVLETKVQQGPALAPQIQQPIMSGQKPQSGHQAMEQFNSNPSHARLGELNAPLTTNAQFAQQP